MMVEESKHKMGQLEIFTIITIKIYRYWGKNKLITFLKDGKSSVAAILWGHGGVGKTATIQSVCDDFSNSERKFFDYVIFLSAKDRIYNIHTGDVNDITDRVVNYHICWLL